MDKDVKIALVAGGTGGHIFPAMALEKELTKNESVKNITFLATTTSLSRRVLKKRKGDLISIPSHGFIGKRFYEKVLAIAYVLGGLFRSLILLKKEMPDVACGFGGYGTFAFLLMCYIRRIPFILHEQNLIPGRVTRFLSRYSKEVLISFPDSQDRLPFRKAFFTGNLCQEDFVTYHRSLPNFGYEPENKRLIIVVGGSQGSHFLNQNLPRMLLKILSDFPELSLIHISGEKERKSLKKIYGVKNSRVEVLKFSLDMLRLLKEARLVISRAGATILSEISLCGVPSILIPFAKSSDNHQYHNARWFRERGAALLIEEVNFTEEFFYCSVRDLLHSHSQLKKMSSVLLSLAQPDATKLAAERLMAKV